ncbi:hypothetical protein TNCV_1413201 [Trichonephila clavipes]|nr:hypothetical protein TNCV_1413201 [Trichonephila clavipes]
MGRDLPHFSFKISSELVSNNFGFGLDQKPSQQDISDAYRLIATTSGTGVGRCQVSRERDGRSGSRLKAHCNGIAPGQRVNEFNSNQIRSIRFGQTHLKHFRLNQSCCASSNDIEQLRSLKTGLRWSIS